MCLVMCSKLVFSLFLFLLCSVVVNLKWANWGPFPMALRGTCGSPYSQVVSSGWVGRVPLTAPLCRVLCFSEGSGKPVLCCFLRGCGECALGVLWAVLRPCVCGHLGWGGCAGSGLWRSGRADAGWRDGGAVSWGLGLGGAPHVWPIVPMPRPAAPCSWCIPAICASVPRGDSVWVCLLGGGSVEVSEVSGVCGKAVLCSVV